MCLSVCVCVCVCVSVCVWGGGGGVCLWVGGWVGVCGCGWVSIDFSVYMLPFVSALFTMFSVSLYVVAIYMCIHGTHGPSDRVVCRSAERRGESSGDLGFKSFGKERWS